MTIEDYRREVLQYESEGIKFEAAHELWRSKKTEVGKSAAFGALASIASCLVLIVLLANWRALNVGKIVGGVFGISVFFRYAEKWDLYWNARRLDMFVRRNPEPVFKLEFPVWVDADAYSEDVSSYDWPEEVPSPRMILGVEETASLDEIKRAYRQRIKQCHPDKFAYLGDQVKQVAEEHAKTLNAAYASVLAETS
jgi:hypothetical protein